MLRGPVDWGSWDQVAHRGLEGMWGRPALLDPGLACPSQTLVPFSKPAGPQQLLDMKKLLPGFLKEDTKRGGKVNVINDTENVEVKSKCYFSL